MVPKRIAPKIMSAPDPSSLHSRRSRSRPTGSRPQVLATVDRTICQPSSFRATILAMTTLPLADVKNRLSEVVNDLVATHERVVMTRNGRPAAVLIAPDDLESLEETLAVLADQGLIRQLVASRADVAAGRVHSADELADAMQPVRRDR